MRHRNSFNLCLCEVTAILSSLNHHIAFLLFARYMPLVYLRPFLEHVDWLTYHKFIDSFYSFPIKKKSFLWNAVKHFETRWHTNLIVWIVCGNNNLMNEKKKHGIIKKTNRWYHSIVLSDMCPANQFERDFLISNKNI